MISKVLLIVTKCYIHKISLYFFLHVCYTGVNLCFELTDQRLQGTVSRKPKRYMFETNILFSNMAIRNTSKTFSHLHEILIITNPFFDVIAKSNEFLF